MTRPARVIVAEDEPLARERIVTLVQASPDLVLIGQAEHGLEALDRIVALQPDLAFLDVEMPELGGFDVVAALSAEHLCGIVFITAHAEHAPRAFEVDAIDFLQKPVTPDRFAATVQRALRRLGPGRPPDEDVARAVAMLRDPRSRKRTRYVVRRGSTHTFVMAGEVAWIGAADNYLELHAGGRTHLVRGTIREAEDELDPASFIRIHRSTIVNIAHVASVEAQPSGGYVLRMSDGARLRTSRQYAGSIRALVTARGR